MANIGSEFVFLNPEHYGHFFDSEQYGNFVNPEHYGNQPPQHIIDNIGSPFSFVNPGRYGNHLLSSSPQHAQWEQPGTATAFPRFSRLPSGVRRKIIRFAIENAFEYWEDWHEDHDNPVMLQSRRGVLRRQLQYKEPPSLPQLACVSFEWQHETEQRLFKTLRLSGFPGDDLAAFSDIVTEPRRQYLVDLELDSYRKYPTHRRTGSGDTEFYRTGHNYECLIRLFQILGSWDQEEPARDDSLRLSLDIELQDFPLHHLLEEIMNLPDIPIIGVLEINMESEEFSKLPLALLSLLRKLPQLELVKLHLSPWCFSNESDKDRAIQDLADGLNRMKSPLGHLEFDIPFIHRHPQRHGIPNDTLGGPPISSIRQLSYLLTVLKLTSPIDLSLFFEHFIDVGEGPQLTSCSRWHVLQTLWLRGSITRRIGAKQGQPEADFLKCVGHATRTMPELLEAFVKLEPPPGSGSETDQMEIVFFPLEVEQNVEDGFLLSIHNHIPSPSAVNIWKEAHMHTKRLELGVRFFPAFSLDENGEPGERSWHTWEG